MNIYIYIYTYIYTGIIVPLILSSSPRNCLAVGGDLITVYGRHFLQRKKYGGNFDNKEKLNIMCIEVLVNEIPVDGKDVSILSDSELCFILPPTVKPGVFMIVLRLIDQDNVSETINPTFLVSTESSKVTSTPGIYIYISLYRAFKCT
jgi:hypothetical protein